MLDNKPAGRIEIVHQLKRADCSKIAWNYKVHVECGEIVVEKEINVWVREETIWSRIYHDCFSLDWYNCNIENEQGLLKTCNGQLFVNRNTIQFAGGFLRIEDTGLFCHISNNTDLEVKDSEVEATSDLLASDCKPEEFPTDINVESPNRLEPVWKNIHIEVVATSEGEQKFQPLFSFPQNDDLPKKKPKDYGDTQLNIKQESDGTNSMLWEISKQNFKTNPYKLNGEQRIVISQDANWIFIPKSATPENKVKAKQAYFEYYVNSIALKTSGERIKISPDDNADALTNSQVETYRDSVVDHHFETGSKCFYVGFNPQGDQQESNELVVFQGNIRRIFFDPNASCPTCPA